MGQPPRPPRPLPKRPSPLRAERGGTSPVEAVQRLIDWIRASPWRIAAACLFLIVEAFAGYFLASLPIWAFALMLVLAIIGLVGAPDLARPARPAPEPPTPAETLREAYATSDMTEDELEQLADQAIDASAPMTVADWIRTLNLRRGGGTSGIYAPVEIRTDLDPHLAALRDHMERPLTDGAAFPVVSYGNAWERTVTDPGAKQPPKPPPPPPIRTADITHPEYEDVEIDDGKGHVEHVRRPVRVGNRYVKPDEGRE